MKYFVLLMACALVLTFSAKAQTTSVKIDPETPKGEATIRGHVIYDDNDKPARRVPIILMNTTRASNQRIAITDNKGDFSFKNVAEGTYKVGASFAGYTNGFASDETDKTNAVEVAIDSSSDADVKIRAIRGASITGRVTYPDGEPVIGAQLNVYRKVLNQWAHVAIVASGTDTDDRGIYRIYPLRAGEYVISVIERSMRIEERDGGTMQSVGNDSISPYFYQDATNLQNATVIDVDAGRETTNVNFTLAERPTHEVAGIITANEKPLPGAYLRINQRDNLSGPTLTRPLGVATKADEQGRWVFKGVPDGIYDIELDYTWAGNLASSADRFLSQRQEVTVAGADLSGITINLTEGGKISGTIVVEGGKPLPRGISAGIELVSTSNPYRHSSTVHFENENVFRITGIPPGDNILTFSTDTSYFVKSITWKGRDLLRQPIKVERGVEISDVKVVLSTEFGSLNGRILSTQDRKPLTRTRFALLPVDENRWIGLRAFQGMIGGMSDNAGAFKVQGAPGEYFIVVFVEGTSLRSFEDIKELARKSQRVFLKPSTPNEIDVIVP